MTKQIMILSLLLLTNVSTKCQEDATTEIDPYAELYDMPNYGNPECDMEQYNAELDDYLSTFPSTDYYDDIPYEDSTKTTDGNDTTE